MISTKRNTQSDILLSTTISSY